MASSNQFVVQGSQFRGQRGRGRGIWRGLGRGAGQDSSRGRGNSVGNYAPQRNARPTHFLALPLHNHPALCSRVAAFQAALFGDGVQNNTGVPRNTIRTSSHVEGLDSSIVIDPVRMHMTLGVMALEDDMIANGTSSHQQRKTVSTALALLASLSPQISQILDGERGVKVPLDVLDVLKTEKIRTRGSRETGTDEKLGAGVLFLGPRESSRVTMDDERRKLVDVCELINRTFRDAGYVTDHRPLKLHCTILNASHRKPRGRFPFSYTDIRSNKRACDLIRSTRLATGSQDLQTHTGPMPVNLGAWKVNEVQLWIMGSRDREGRYVNCGGIKLGGH